jgi:hypothetical protein
MQILRVGCGFVNGICDDPMPGHFLGDCKFCAQATFLIRGNAAGNDQADPTACPFGEELSHTDVTILLFLKTGVHRSHDCTVLDRRVSDLKRGEEVGILGCNAMVIGIFVAFFCCASRDMRAFWRRAMLEGSYEVSGRFHKHFRDADWGSVRISPLVVRECDKARRTQRWWVYGTSFRRERSCARAPVQSRIQTGNCGGRKDEVRLPGAHS